MQTTGFVCRSCLSQIRRQCRSSTQLGSARRRLQHASATSQHEPQPLAIPNGRPEGLLGTSIHLDLKDEGIVRKLVSERPRDHDTKNRIARHVAKVAAEETAHERTFDLASYPAEDKDFWNKYDELWQQPSDWSQDATAQADRTVKKSNRNNAVFPKARRTSKTRWWGQTTEKRKTELFRATQNVEDVPRARKKLRIWKKNFSNICAATHAGSPPPAGGLPSDLKWLLTHDGAEAMKEAWQSRSKAKREASWIHVMAGALRYVPDKAHLVLEATLDDKQLEMSPFYVVNDSINLLAQRTRLELSGVNKEELLQNLCELILLVLRKMPDEYLSLRQNTLYLILSQAKPMKAAELYEALKTHGHPLHSYTLLQFGRSLAQDVDYKPVALDILRELATSSSVDINSPHGAALCTSILSLTEEDALKDLKPSPAELFEMLLRLGLKPNLITYTTIIRNLCLNKELNVAWEVFSTMKQHQIEPDIHVYSILLNGAKLSDDFESISRVLSLASAQGVGTSILWNDVLHTIFLLYVQEARTRRLKRPWRLPAFQPMLRAYAKLFQIEPLQSLIQSDLAAHLQREGEESGEMEGTASWRVTSKALALIKHLPSREPKDRLPPESDTLGLMLLGYIGGFEKAYNIIAFYSRFRGQLKNGDPAVTRFVNEKGTLLHNIIIKAVVEWPGMLRVALDVVSDMIKDSVAASSARSRTDASASAGWRTHGEAVASRHPPPCSYTWNILLNGFMHHRHHQQGERILTMMREHGIEPDEVTWNTLIAGYARAQMAGPTVGALQRLERAGFRAGEYTMRGFSYLSNRKAAVDMMVNLRARQLEKDARSKLRDELEAQEDLGAVESALRQMDTLVDEVAHETDGPGIEDLEIPPSYGWVDVQNVAAEEHVQSQDANFLDNMHL